ncbi:MAG: TetR/AcrR family transcriptional regulator [Alphaproteobacteria bacterium]
MATRDAEATRQNILDAVGRVLARDGFSGLGVNAIAKEAGIGKPLIYRYFGGLPQLLEEFGRDADFWLGIDDILAEVERETGGAEQQDYGELIRLALVGYARVLRKRPMVVEILASELTAPAEIIAPLAKARRDTGREALEEFLDGVEPPAGVDVDAIFGIFLASFHYLILRGRVDSGFWSVPIDDEDEWARFENAMSLIIRQVFAET